MRRILHSSPVPLVVVDGDRRFVQANAPALLALRTDSSEIQRERLDDRSPLHRLPLLDRLWRRLVATGHLTGAYDVANRDGTGLRIVFYAIGGVPHGCYVIAFAPSAWSGAELRGARDERAERPTSLTPRELEMLELAADGRNGPRIAEELAVSPATVKTHFENVYSKLGVRDRAAAVARAMRLGLID